jgi:dipeptidyl aminopeptidase/acylaminoacyl peptidase
VYFAHCSYDCKARDGIYRVSGGRALRVADSRFPTHLVASGSRVAIAEITTSRIDRSSPAWSPSGDKIAFARTQREPSGSAWRIVESGSGIYVRGRRQNGGERRLIAGVTTSLDWSRDGQFVFERPVPDDNDGDLFIANADGTGERHLTAGASPRWSPDGSRIAFARDGQIFVVNEDGSGLARVAAGYGVAWSPDGTRLAVASSGAVEFIGVDGTPAGRLPRLSGYPSDLDWSPEGSRIAYSESSDESTRTEIHITRLDGGGRRTLARIGEEAESLGPRWAPDGRVLAFAHGDAYVVYPEEPVPFQLFLTAGAAVRRLTAPAKQRSTISVRRTVGGSLQARFDLAADVMDLALSPSFLAVLVRKGNAVRLQIRDARTGTLRRSFHSNACCSIQIADSSTVLVNDQLLDINSGRVTRLPTIPTPIKRPRVERLVGWGPLLIEGRRLTWVETFQIEKKYKSRIRVLSLPKR